MILGSVLRNHAGSRTVLKNVVAPLGIIFAVFAGAAVGYKFEWGVLSYFFTDSLSVVTGLLVYSIFMLLKDARTGNKTVSKIISEIALCSYGIYLTHLFIARDIVWKIVGWTGAMDCHPAVYIPVSFVLSFVLSWGVVRVIKFLPWGKYIVG
jgi:peptidoglycan/LPS O-acetylase OafA/YrhL